MRVKQIYKGLYLYTFSNQFELCSTFFRLQEFYESPMKKLRGNYFTYEQAIDSYAYLELKDKNGAKFTYFEDWNGFNVPGNAVREFNCLFEGDITKKENKMLEKIDYLKTPEFYIIGAVDKDISCIKHEIGHGLYYLNPKYRTEMVTLVNDMPKGMRKMAENHLLDIGYAKTVLEDELHAYFSTGIRKGMICIWHHIVYQRYIQKFRKVFKRYYKEVKMDQRNIIQRSLNDIHKAFIKLGEVNVWNKKEKKKA